MIPSTNSSLMEELEIARIPSKTYKMNIEDNVINGKCDGKKAVEQAIYNILNTERYQYIMYSWNYGIELIDLFGEPVTYACPELERRIREALSVDDRIISCEEFKFDVSQKGIIIANFLVQTVFGNIEIEKAVNI